MPNPDNLLPPQFELAFESVFKTPPADNDEAETEKKTAPDRCPFTLDLFEAE